MKMKKTVLALVALSTILACSEKESKNNLHLTGNVSGLKKGTLYIQRLKDTSLVTIDSIKIEGDSKFETNIAIESPEMFYLSLNRGVSNSLDNNLLFFAEPGEMNIETNLDQFSYGAKVILIKCGTPGIYFRTAAKEQLLKIGGGIGEEIAETWAVKEAFEKSYFVEKDKVASGTGAGDTTIAAFLSAILEGKSWEDALHLATATGALCVQTYDALSGIIPLEEVQKKIDAGWEKRK